ncbi:CDP-diacylglycerol--glycerol-3-phosphate 3-phosphatidyltransferase [bacterium]|nr:CDP-diacylglycerol--glycerol-3-phosphate 3-phosphatidyltransferase [bacterium]
MINRLPNILTALRIVLALCFLAAESYERCLWAQAAGLGIFILASVTDIVDGYLARKYGAITRLGRFMDPIADKILIAAALVVFVDSPFVRVPAWPVALIIAREFSVTGLRLLAAADGVTVGAETIGKLKTIVQMVSLHYILIVALAENAVRLGQAVALAPYMRMAHLGVDICLYTTTAITVYSGIEYLVKNYKHLVTGSEQS